MSQRIGSPGRRARLHGVAQSIRRYLGTLDDEHDSIWRTAQQIDANRSIIKGEDGVIANHRERVDEPWFEKTTVESGDPRDDGEVDGVKLTEAGREANRADAYDLGGQVDASSQPVATDGGHVKSPGDTEGGV